MNQTENRKQKSDVFNSARVFVYFSDFLKGLKKFWWVIIVLAALVGGFKFYTAQKNFVPVYTSKATFTVSTQTSTSSVNGISAYSFFYDSATVNQLIKTFPYIMSSNVLRDSICEDLDITAIPVDLRASSDTGSNMFTLTATGRDPQMTYDVLLSAVDNYPVAAKYVVGNIKLKMITTPKLATVPSNSSDSRNQALKGALHGALLGLLWVFLYALQRKTVKIKKDITAQLNCEALGVIPEVSFKKHTKAINKSILFTNSNVGKPFMESFRVLRNVVLHSLNDGEKVIMSTSTAPSEGKTTIIVNLALSFGAYGKNVLLVDADLRNPSVSKQLGINIDSFKTVKETDKYKIVQLEDSKISFMHIKSDKNYHKFMNSKEIKHIFNDVRDSYDLILVDTPPCGLVSDALYIAQASDAAIYVVRQDLVRVLKIRSGLDNLMSTNTKVLGCVINGAKSGVSGYGSNDGYGYGSYGKYGYGKSSKRNSH